MNELVMLSPIIKDAGFAIGIVGLVVIYKKMDDSFKNLKLERTEQAIIGDIRRLPKVEPVKQDKLDKTGIKKEASEIIKEFVSTFKSEGIDLSNLYRNFRPYCIEEVSKSDHAGKYDLETHRLLVDPNNLRETLLRALLKEASASVYPGFITNGFERINMGLDNRGREIVVENLGVGLNVGYTEILLGRYFELPRRYDEVTEVVELIETIVGQKSMESLFFQGDLKRLVYDSGVCSINFEDWIKKLDRVYYSLYGNKGKTAKKLGEASYRSLVIDVSRKLIYKAAIHYCITHSAIETSQMIEDINFLLFLRSKTSSKHYGLLESDIDAIKSYGDTILSRENFPKSFQIRKTYHIRNL